MKLYIKDRIYIPQILPQQNTFAEYSAKREILKKVALTEEDAAKYDMKEDQENKRTTWSMEKDLANPLEATFTPQELAYLKAACEKVADGQFADDFWATVEKIYNEI